MSPQVALVTGSGSGIGRSIALQLASHGFVVGLVGRSAHRLEAVAEVARQTSPGVECFVADLSVDEEVASLTHQATRLLGGLDVLVHGAGGIRLGRVDQASVEALDWHYRINLRAPFLLTQALLPTLSANEGQIVFINSGAALNPAASNGQYAATKAGLRAIADSLRLALNPEGIRVLTVYPGRTASGIQAEVHRFEKRPFHPETLMQPDDVASVVVAALLLPRSAEITDLMVRPMRKTID
jgi:NADP-dependent 3-hydroxy acid dehydrogenase YdfG